LIVHTAASIGRGERPHRPPLGDSDRTRRGACSDSVRGALDVSVRLGSSQHGLGRFMRDAAEGVSCTPSAIALAHAPEHEHTDVCALGRLGSKRAESAGDASASTRTAPAQGEVASGAPAPTRSALRRVVAPAVSPCGNGTSLGSARRSPAGSAHRWRPARALGRPVLTLGGEAQGLRTPEAMCASACALADAGLGRAVARAVPQFGNGTSLGSARRSPAGSAHRWRPARALGRPVSILGVRASASALADAELRCVVTRAVPQIDNGTSLGSARRSPAGSAHRWRPARALGRPVLTLGDRASASALADAELRCVVTRAVPPFGNGTSLGSARRSPAGSAHRWRPARALGRPVSILGVRASAWALADAELRCVVTRAASPFGNGTSLGSARRSPAGSAHRWRPARALGRPVSILGDRASASALADAELRCVVTRAVPQFGNGTSLGSARRSPAGSAHRWRPARALGRPVLTLGDRAGAWALADAELRRAVARAASQFGNGTSLGSARRSPAGSAHRWRPARALGRPVLTLGDRAGASALADAELGRAVARAVPQIDNGTSLGSARRSPAGSAHRWRPARALGRPVLTRGDDSMKVRRPQELRAGAESLAHGLPRRAVACAASHVGNGTSLGSA
jgi:hypothetical protein